MSRKILIENVSRELAQENKSDPFVYRRSIMRLTKPGWIEGYVLKHNKDTDIGDLI